MRLVLYLTERLPQTQDSQDLGLYRAQRWSPSALHCTPKVDTQHLFSLEETWAVDMADRLRVAKLE